MRLSNHYTIFDLIPLIHRKYSAPIVRHGVMFLTFFSVLAAGAAARDIPATSTGDIRFYLDSAAFSSRSGNAFVELYLMLFADQLSDQKDGKEHYCVFHLASMVQDGNEKTISRKTWSTRANFSPDLVKKTLSIYDQWTETLAPGVYHVRLEVSDSVSHQTGSAILELNIPAFPEKQLCGSQIEFVTQVAPASDSSPFVKAGKSVMPNPARRFGVLNPVMYFYYELYGLDNFTSNSLNAVYALDKPDGTTVKSYPAVEITKPGATAALVHGVDVSAIPFGIYELRITVSEKGSDKTVVLRRQFEVIQMDELDGQPRMTEGQIRIADRLIKYLVSKEDYDFFHKLTIAGKTRYVLNFWRDHDPTPGTLENEYLTQIQQRYQYAQAHFSWGGIEGWSTERGRILIQYGMPDEIQRYSSEAETNPYEIWMYRQQKSYSFVFGDLKDDGHYILLHSDQEAEIHNPDWLSMLNKL
jgi:GWxTD domain-containing protein